jgi:predicted dehydrogenase
MAALDRIRSTVVGLGGMSFEHLEKLGRLASVDVAGVCDLSGTLVDAVADRFGVDGRYTSYERMLDELRPDAVHVLTPPQTHKELALGALSQGAHVLVEKPAAPTYDDWAEMRERAEQHGVLLVENLNYRTMPVVSAILDARDAGELGEIVHVDVSMGISIADPGSVYLDPEVVHFAHGLPGGALQNFASHPASIATALVGGPRSVRVAQRKLNQDSLGSDELRALVVAESGTATIALTPAKPLRITVRVQGTKATVEGDVFSGRLAAMGSSSPLGRIAEGFRHGAGHVSATVATVGRTVGGRNYWFIGFERLVSDFYDAIAAGGPSPIPVAEMDASNRLLAELFDPENQL